MGEGISQAQIDEALNSDNGKQQFLEMVFQAKSDKFAMAELRALDEQSQVREQLRLGALAMRRQEEERAIQELQVELTGLKLATLQKRALLSGITSNLVDAALDDVSDAKQALIAICIEAEVDGLIQQIHQSPSPIPRMSTSGSPTAPTRVRQKTHQSPSPVPRMS